TIFSYYIDGGLLAHFATIPIARGNILDLCTRNGVIPLLLSSRTKANLTGVEIQHRLADMAKRSISINALSNQVSIVEGDLKVRQDKLKQHFNDTVTRNHTNYKTTK